MNTTMLFERLFQNHSLTANLNGSQAEQLLNWASAQIEECTSEAQFQRLLEDVRLLNRYVAQGGDFEHMLATLRQGSRREHSTQFPRSAHSSWSNVFPIALIY